MAGPLGAPVWKYLTTMSCSVKQSGHIYPDWHLFKSKAAKSFNIQVRNSEEWPGISVMVKTNKWEHETKNQGLLATKVLWEPSQKASEAKCLAICILFVPSSFDYFFPKRAE